jgi:rhomboid protease GluP
VSEGHQDDERLRAFRETLVRFTPRAVVTYAIITVNVGLYVVMVSTGVHGFSPEPEVLVRWGAGFGPFTASGEWWRLLTAAFIHIGLLHLMMNMWVLFTAGPLVERLLGNTGFAVVYLLSGLLGGLASLAWNPEAVSAGASGAVFGVFGALAAFLVLRHRQIPLQVLHGLRLATLIFVGFNLLFGMMHRAVDAAAHVGGLVGGFACALPLCHRFTGASWRRRWWRNLAVAVAGGGLVAGGAALLRNDAGDLQRELDRFVVVEKRCVVRYNEALRRLREGESTDPELAATLRRDVLPGWRAARRRVLGFRDRKLPALYRRKLERVSRYMELRERGWLLFAEALERRDKEKAARALELQDRAERAMERVR